MNAFVRNGLIALALLVVLGVLAAAAAEPDGKAVFTSQKCSMCHSVQSAGIEKTMKSSKAKDLSTIGSERDSAWLTKWLKKEEKIDGKAHMKTFTGSDADLTALVSWLGSLKK
jgi:cytochrome c551/c552